MNIKFWIIICCQILFFVTIVNCQKVDTTFYDNGKIRSIEIKKKKKMLLREFYSETGEDLMEKMSFDYSYFDKQMDMNRYVLVENGYIEKEYWYNDKDTLYNRAKFDPSLDLLINRFLEYVSYHLKFPEEALNNNIEGKVIISFIVNKKGKIIFIRPITKIGYGLEYNASKMIETYSNWGVVYLEGKPINCYFRFPVNYVHSTFDE